MMTQNKILPYPMWPYATEQIGPLMPALSKTLPGSQDQEVLTVDSGDVQEMSTKIVVDISKENDILNVRTDENTTARLVSDDYTCVSDDYYIGVNSNGPTQITLPPQPKNGKVVVVKAEMSSALLNRRVTIITADGSLIDGRPKHMIVKSYGVVNLLYREGNWNVI